MGARYGFALQRTASATLDVGSILTAASSPRRFRMMEIIFGSEAPPADNSFLWQVNKRTGAPTGGTSVVGQPNDDSDTIASTLVGNQNPTANGTGSGIKLHLPLNQRVTYRWVASERGSIVSAAVASTGFGISTPTMTAVAVSAHVQVEEL